LTRVAVISGGVSSEHEVSLSSGKGVAGGLRQAGHEVIEVLIGRQGRWAAEGEELALTPGEGLLGADVAFPVLHGPGGEDGSVQGLLECLGVPYVGSDVAASALCLDKLSFKRLLSARGVPQVDFCQAGEQDWRRRAASLGLPLWVKPSRLGSSVGISKVEDGVDLERAVKAAGRHDPRVVIEASAGGKEVECSLLGNSEVRASPPGEIVAHADWYDYEAKYQPGGMELIVPARIEPASAERVRELALEVFALCGCSGMGRCDFFVDDDGEVLVNELNTIPGFTETSVYGKLLEADGIPYPQLCDRLVQLALERHRELGSYEY
jgi:D-alanine-D-alanine ligase